MKTYFSNVSLMTLALAFALALTGCKKDPVEEKLLTVDDSQVAVMNSIDAFWQWTGQAGYTSGSQSWLDPVVSKFLEGNPIVEKKYVR